MIFFSIPSVGQLKPSTLFSEDDHFGFIQTVIGDEYVRANITSKCLEYYGKTNLRYWDQIITIINFLGIKRLDSENRFRNISVLELIAQNYDENNFRPAEVLFDYLLSQWQFPHPIVTTNRPIKSHGLKVVDVRKKFPFTKPYQIIISLLKRLYQNDSTSAYFTNEEFYWLGYHFYDSKGENYNLNSIDRLYKDLINVRNKGWHLYKSIKDKDGTRTHLSYPKGFLKNSFVLTDDNMFYEHVEDFFIGLKPIKNIENLLDSLIQNSSAIFEFDRKISERNVALSFKYSEFLYDLNRMNTWIKNVAIYPGLDNIFSGVESEEIKFDDEKFRKLKIERQLQRLATLDREGIARYRTEQHILRDYLLNDKDSGKCAICEMEYPIQFLATAHIKKRKDCNDDEKKDINVVMPACHLGCDKVYEEGYISVVDGEIKSNLKNKHTTKPITSYISRLEGNECNYFNELNAKYFYYHAGKSV